MAEPSNNFEGVTPNLVLQGNPDQGVCDLLVHRNHEGFISCWQLTEEELKMIAETGKIYIQVCGSGHPPIAVSADSMVLVAPLDTISS